MAAQTVYMSPISMIIQILNNLGIVAPGAQLFTYQAGTVSSLATTYSESTGQVPNANPLIANAAGRIVSASGAPVAFWTLPGQNLKLVILDAQGNLLVGPIDNIPAINDLTNSNNALQTLLAQGASSNQAGTGPVGGADLVANAVKSYDVFATVRTANVPIMASGQTLIIETQGAITVGDNLGGSFYWSGTSTANDDGTNVLKPNNLAPAAAGRYLRIFPKGIPQGLVKTQDQQVVSSTALVNDTQLTFNLVPGNYLLQARLQMLGNGGTGGGYKVAIAFTGTLGNVNAGVGLNSVNGSGSVLAMYVQTGSVNSSATVSSTTGDIYQADIPLTVTVAGILVVQFAQNSSNVNGLIMKAGSQLILTRLA